MVRTRPLIRRGVPRDSTELAEVRGVPLLLSSGILSGFLQALLKSSGTLINLRRATPRSIRPAFA